MRLVHWQVAAGLFIALAAVGLAAALGPSAAAAPGTAPVTLEGLLKASGLDYAKADEAEGVFKIVVTMDDETSLIIAQEAALSPDPDHRLGQVFTLVVRMPEDVRPSQAMLKRMAELNDTLLVGKLGLGENSVFYISSFWLRNADGQTVMAEVALAHMIRSAARQELLPFLEE
jgi:hypothetical protein